MKAYCLRYQNIGSFLYNTVEMQREISRSPETRFALHEEHFPSVLCLSLVTCKSKRIKCKLLENTANYFRTCLESRRFIRNKNIMMLGVNMIQ